MAPDAAREGYGRIAIAGVGLIGGSLALALRRKGLAREVIGVGRSETTGQALGLGLIDRALPYESLGEAARGADLVILATPIRRILELIEMLGRGGALEPGTVVTDVGSTKRRILDAARILPAGVHFIGGHPMAGSEKTGPGAADPFLFQNAIYVLAPAPGVPGDDVGRLSRTLERIGARVVVIDAAEHDRLAAAVSHLPQLTAVALVRHAGALRSSAIDPLRLAAGGFRDMTRIASSPFSVWKDIIETNASEIRAALDGFIARLAALRDSLDAESLAAEFDAAAFTRSGIPRDMKGFMSPLSELLVVVEDKPGVIAGISNALAAEGINIKDIEVLKVREGEGGTLRLAFVNRPVAERAKKILEGLGHTVRLRE
ncbi:MAG: prephenate dehydrogenase [Planctomycetes bacterium]|nr:prephenate dehydrogenase [Planctomycetota bacterium]